MNKIILLLLAASFLTLAGCSEKQDQTVSKAKEETNAETKENPKDEKVDKGELEGVDCQ
jgi:PBP1b-binding outer membrane lipoprotein LpoB